MRGAQSFDEKTPGPNADDSPDRGRVSEPDRKRECEACSIPEGAGGMRAEGKGFSSGVGGPELGREVAPPRTEEGSRSESVGPSRERAPFAEGDARLKVEGRVPARGRPAKARGEGTGVGRPCSCTVGSGKAEEDGGPSGGGRSWTWGGGAGGRDADKSESSC